MHVYSGVRTAVKSYKYLIRWNGKNWDDTWETAASLGNAALVEELNRKFDKREKGRKKKIRFYGDAPILVANVEDESENNDDGE